MHIYVRIDQYRYLSHPLTFYIPIPSSKQNKKLINQTINQLQEMQKWHIVRMESSISTKATPFYTLPGTPGFLRTINTTRVDRNKPHITLYQIPQKGPARTLHINHIYMKVCLFFSPNSHNHKSIKT